MAENRIPESAGARELAGAAAIRRTARVRAARRGERGLAALAADPAQVRRCRGRSADEVDLLPLVLSNVAHVEVAGVPIEGEAEGVAHSDGPDLVAGARLAGIGIVVGHRVVGAVEAALGGDGSRIHPAHVDAQDLSQQGARALAVSRDSRAVVALRSAIARRDVQVAVRTERQLAAVVVGRRMVDAEDDGPGSRIGDIRIAGRSLIALDHDVAVREAGVVDVEAAGRPVVGLHGHREEPPLTAVQDLVETRGSEVEEGHRQQRLRLARPDEDHALLRRDEAVPQIVRRIDEGDRRIVHPGETGDEGRHRGGRVGSAGRRAGPRVALGGAEQCGRRHREGAHGAETGPDRQRPQRGVGSSSHWGIS